MQVALVGASDPRRSIESGGGGKLGMGRTGWLRSGINAAVVS